MGGPNKGAAVGRRQAPLSADVRLWITRCSCFGYIYSAHRKLLEGYMNTVSSNSTQLFWEKVNRQGHAVTFRTAVPGGWLVRVSDQQATTLTFLPDGDQEWDPREGVSYNPPNNGWYIRLTEMVDPDTRPIPTTRRIDINFHKVAFVRPSIEGETVDGAKSVVTVDGVEIPVVENQAEIAELLSTQDVYAQ